MVADGDDRSREKSASVAGWALVSMAIVATFAVYSTQGVIVQGDAIATAAKIASHQGLFRAGLCAWLLVALLDVLVAVALYVVLAPVSRWLALLAAAVRIVYAAVLAAGLGGLFDALRLVEPGASSPADQVLLCLERFGDVWTAGLVLFGVHLMLVAHLVRSSGVVPWAIGALLWLASAGYVIGDVATIVAPTLGAMLEPILVVPEAVGELAFAVWLIARARAFSASPSAPVPPARQLAGDGD